MPRGRYIKPSFSKNEVLAELTFPARLLFALLPCHADCEGKLEDRPKRLHIELYPYEPNIDFDGLLNELFKAGFITRYSANGENFIFINKFLEHQSPTTGEKKIGSKIPDYDPKTDKAALDSPDYNKLQPVITTPALTVTETETETVTGTGIETQPDPNFKIEKFTPEDVAKLTALATTEYKNTQFPHEVQPWIINLLGSVSAETLETAIKNAASYGNKDHKFRKNFSKMFESAEAVEEMAKMTAKKPVIRKNDVNIEDWN